jgi:DNA-binding NtrC family response regulator
MVTSDLGRGTAFEVLLPLCAPAISEDTPPVVCLATGRQRVLFVDDDPALANVMNVALGHFGYEVTAFTDPVKAMEAFGLRPSGFDILVTDATMPSLTGHLLAASIKKIRPDLPMILVSGAADRVVQDEAHASPFAAFLDKPYRPSALAQIIQDVCSKRALTKRHS